MRLLVLALILGNLVLFAWAQFARDAADRSRLSQLEVSPQRVRIMKAASGAGPERLRPPAKGDAAKAAVAEPAACLEWGTFAGPDAARAEAAVAGLGLPAERVERNAVDATGYWVYLPPLKNRVEAERKAGELKSLGVTGYFVVQESGPWRYAVSLGIFRSDETAQAYLAKLREQGVRSAVAEQRENFLRQTTFLVRDPDKALVARLATLQQDFPGSELTATQCPAAAPSKG